MGQVFKITDEEAATVGITPDTPCDGPQGWGTLVLDLLRAHGVPETHLETNNMKCVPAARHPMDSKMFEELNPSVPGVVFVVAD